MCHMSNFRLEVLKTEDGQTLYYINKLGGYGYISSRLIFKHFKYNSRYLEVKESSRELMMARLSKQQTSSYISPQASFK